MENGVDVTSTNLWPAAKGNTEKIKWTEEIVVLTYF